MIIFIWASLCFFSGMSLQSRVLLVFVVALLFLKLGFRFTRCIACRVFNLYLFKNSWKRGGSYINPYAALS